LFQKSEESEVDASSDVFIASSSKGKKPRAPPKKKPKVEVKDEESSPSKSPTKRKSKKEEEEEEEKYRWWEMEALGDGTQKWTTLEHSGVLFPPPYEPLPKTVKLYYDGVCARVVYILKPYSSFLPGRPVDLPPESEEVAGFFGTMLETDHAKDTTFQKNFFKDFLGVLEHRPVWFHPHCRAS
jgi:DNA topoisomerase-1